MNILLKLIETEGLKLGLKLNRSKCKLIQIGSIIPVKFPDGQVIAPSHEVKYLGCQMNEQGDGKKEVNKRITACMAILKKLDLFWLHADVPTPKKIQVVDAVLRSKL